MVSGREGKGKAVHSFALDAEVPLNTKEAKIDNLKSFALRGRMYKDAEWERKTTPLYLYSAQNM